MSAPGTPSSSEATGAPPATLTAFGLSFVTLIGSSTAMMSLSVIAPLLMLAAGMPPEAFGWVSGAAGLGSVWMYMANTAFTVPLGPVKALIWAAGITLTGIGLVATAFYPLIVVGALLIGFGYATSTPAGSQILADNTPARLRSRIFSLRQAGVPFGGVVAGVAGSWIAAQHGWRTALVAIAALLIVTSIPLVIAPRRFNETRPLSQFRLRNLFAVSNLREPFRALATIPGLKLIALASIGFATVQGVTNAFFVTFMAAGLGYSFKLAGAIYAANQVASVAGRIGYGFVADWVGSPRPVLCVLAFTSSLSALLIASTGADWSTPALFAMAIASGLSIATWNGLYMAEVASLAPDAVSQATAGATFFLFGTYVVIPPLAGAAILYFGYRFAFTAVAVCVAITGVVLLLGWRGKLRG